MIRECSNKKSNKIFTKKFIVDKNRKISIFTLYYAQRIKELRQIALTKKNSQVIESQEFINILLNHPFPIHRRITFLSFP